MTTEEQAARIGAYRKWTAKSAGEKERDQLDAFLKLPPKERIDFLGHRAYVGGDTAEKWYGIGRRQYHFLVSVGLKPNHKFLDVACGALRLGQFLIPYLEAANYFGIEGEEALVVAGLKDELHFDLAETKHPRFAFNYDFDAPSGATFDYAMAQSLFTHLIEDDIEKCFSKLAPLANPGASFYFTYLEGEPYAAQRNVRTSHANRGWRYPFETIAKLGAKAG